MTMIEPMRRTRRLSAMLGVLVLLAGVLLALPAGAGATEASYDGCLYAGSLSQVTPAENDVTCARGAEISLYGGYDYSACLFAGTLSQFSESGEPNCGRGMLVELQSGDNLFACLYAGRLTQISHYEPSSCGRGTMIGLSAEPYT